MKKQTYRTCVRMSAQEYAMLKEKSAEAGMSANAWLMKQLETNRPMLFREAETAEVMRFVNQVGQEVNAIARSFNSGTGRPDQVDYAIRRLGEAYERVCQLRKLGYLYAV